MKTIDFIKQFHANPHAYTISKIPSTIRSRLRLEPNQHKTEEKKIMINLPRTIEYTNAFPEWDKIQQYYRYYKRYECFVLCDNFVNPSEIKVEYIVKKNTISPIAIRHAINEMIYFKTKHIKFRIECTQIHLENTKRKLNKYQNILQVFQTCKE